MYRSWLTKKKIAVIHVDDNVAVTAVYGAGATKLNLDASVLRCDRSGYSVTRKAGTQILLKNPLAYGIRCRCRNHATVISLILITGSGAAPSFVLED